MSLSSTTARTASAVVATCLALALSGCIFGSSSGGTADPDDASTDASSNDTDSPSGMDGTAEEAGETGDDDGDTQGEDGMTCEDGLYPDGDGDGYGKEGASPVRACGDARSGLVANSEDCNDDDRDIRPDAEEICNGVDDNCNGDRGSSDSSLEPEKCDNQKGVCSGSEIAQCNGSGDGYATCGPSQYGSSYREASDEAWRCDEADNDCDGHVDEACCDGGTAAGITSLSADTEAGTAAAIVPAVSGDEDFMVAWAEGGEVQMRRLAKSGSVVGSPESLEIGPQITSLDVVAGSSGYLIAVTKRDNIRESLQIATVDASLEKTSLREYDENNKMNCQGTQQPDCPTGLTNVRAAADGDTVWLGYAYQRIDGGSGPANRFERHKVRVGAVKIGNGAEVIPPVALSAATKSTRRPPKPVVTVANGTKLVAWWDAKDKKIRGGTVESKSIGDRFNLDVNLLNNIKPLSIGLATVGDTVHLLFPQHRAQSFKIYHTPIELGSNQPKVGNVKRLTGGSRDGLAPRPKIVDADGDGTADRLVVVWRTVENRGGTTTERHLAIGTTSLSSPNVLESTDLTTPTDASGHRWETRGERAAAVWPDDPRVHVRYLPLSIDGAAICTPDAS